MPIRENVPLAPLTTFQVGGPARFFLEAHTVDDVRAGIQFTQQRAAPLFVLGGGSNLVISDAGWPGLVLKIAISGIDERTQNGKALFAAGAGEEWDKLVARAVARNCSGVECLSGIPGNVGGTPVQNVGAYGQEVSETIQSVTALDLRDGQIHELCAEACGFSYRTSIFNTTERGRYIILKVTYALTPDGPPHIAYADLKKHFAGWNQETHAGGCARSGAPDSRQQRDAHHGGRRRLPQRRFILQESDCFGGTASGIGETGGGAGIADPQLSSAGIAEKNLCRLAGGALRLP